jgi:GTP-binding protein
MPSLGSCLVDCPGYGFARASHTDKENWRRFMETYLRHSECLHRVVMLIDIQVGLMDSDKMLVDMLSNTSRPCMIVLTKADKVKDAEIGEQLGKTAEFIKTSGSLCSPIIHAVSSHNGYGMHEFLSNLGYILEMPLLRKSAL